jgi:hypothetical protein
MKISLKDMPILIFKFIGDKTDDAYLLTLRGLYSLQTGA